MIKFFRKIRQNLLMENKTSKYFKYAIGEIILVVIGILIALQINNWNELRKDQQKETVFLKQIHTEFSENKEQFEMIKNFHQKSLNSCIWMLKNQPFQMINLDSLRYHSLWARVAYTFDPSQSSIKSLISSGSINLIQDTELRELLIRWQDLINDYLEEEIEMRQFTLNLFMPFTLDNFKLYLDEERFDEVLNFDQKQLDKYLNLIARKKRILTEILFVANDRENKEAKTEIEKVATTMNLIIEKTR